LLPASNPNRPQSLDGLIRGDIESPSQRVAAFYLYYQPMSYRFSPWLDMVAYTGFATGDVYIFYTVFRRRTGSFIGEAIQRSNLQWPNLKIYWNMAFIAARL
jgi:hypothetical protein